MNNYGKIKWKEFIISDIFDVKDGYYNKKPPEHMKGDIPFLSATKSNNGVSGYYSKEAILQYDKIGNKSDLNPDERIFEGNCIAVTNNGSVGFAFYQEVDFTCSHDVSPLYLKNELLTKNIAMFLIPLIEAAGSTFSYGKKWRPVRMKKSKIMLPVDQHSRPYWAFMEEVIDSKFNTKKDSLISVLEFKINELLDSEISIDDNDRVYSVFNISDIFENIRRGKRIKKDDHLPGNIPYISSTGLNNGLDGFIGNQEEVRSFSKNITIANSGSVGSTFFQPYKYIASDHVTSLTLPPELSDKYVYLYLATMLKRLGEKYSFNREINNKRINNEKIILPVDEIGNPDWHFMSIYMKNIELASLKKILDNLK